MDFSRFKVKIFVLESMFFVGAFAIGILSVLRIKEIIAAQQEIAAQANINLSPDLVNLGNLSTPSFISIEQFITAFLFITIFFLYLIKTEYGGKIISALFILAIFAGAEIIFRVWIGDSAAIFIAFALILTRYLMPRIVIHNIAIIIAVVGVAINFGLSLDPFDAVLLLIAISVYDFLAVYVTGHMVRMFRSTVSLGTVFAIIVPDKFFGLFEKISDVAKNKGKTLLENFVYLGGGDLAFPLILGVSAAMKYSSGSAIFVLIGAILGLFVLNLIFTAQKEMRPMPAMPALAVFSILGFLASLFKI